ncbi:MAG: GNAT family N-acetyltransferase [Pseudomonadota bacterium]
MPDTPTLKTERLLLRPPSEADIPKIVQYLSDLDVSGNCGTIPHPYGVKDAEFFLAKIASTNVTWAIAPTSTQHLVGVIGLSAYQGENAQAELGYWLGKPFWGQGIGFEAAEAAVEFADNTGLDPLYAGYFDTNPGSGRILEKLGFQEVGASMKRCEARDGDFRSIDMIRTSAA